MNDILVAHAPKREPSVPPARRPGSIAEARHRLAVALARRMLLASAGGTVRSGPFRGLRWTHASPLTYVLGTHELEIAPMIERAIAASPARVVSVGTADGYFTVGLARRLPNATIIGFEMDDAARRRCEGVARQNGVYDRIALRGMADAPALAEALGDGSRTLVVADIEGAEVEVLDPDAVPALRLASIVVETHDVLRPGSARHVRERFAATHEVESVVSRSRTMADFPGGVAPWLCRIAPELCGGFIFEDRGGVQEWLLLTPRRR